MNKNITLITFGLIALGVFLFFKNSNPTSTDNVNTSSVQTNKIVVSERETDTKTSIVDETIIQAIEQNSENLNDQIIIELNSDEFVEKEFEIKVRNSPYYPDTPFEAYIKHIDKAEDGDMDSQFIIFSVLKNCELGSDAEIKSVNVEFNHQRSDRLTQLVELYTDHCKNLFEESEANIKQLVFWKKILIENRHPVVHSEHHVNLKLFDNLKQKTGRDYTNGAVIEELTFYDIFSAIDIGNPGNFDLMASYLTAFTPYTHLNTEVRAWNLAECIKFGMCVTDNLLDEYRKHMSDIRFSSNQIDQIISTAYYYIELVENEEWDELYNLYN